MILDLCIAYLLQHSWIVHPTIAWNVRGSITARDRIFSVNEVTKRP